jgi:hypothetical protein
LPARATRSQTRTVIKGVIVHLHNELPILADLLETPEPHAQIVRCTNIRTVDGKRPTFISDPKGTFVFPWHLIRLLELPAAPTEAEKADSRVVVIPLPEPAPEFELPDEEPDEDLLARIRSV